MIVCEFVFVSFLNGVNKSCMHDLFLIGGPKKWKWIEHVQISITVTYNALIVML